MRRLPRLLVATPCPKTFAALRNLFAGDVEMLAAAEPARALEALQQHAFDGVIADSRFHAHAARAVADGFLQRNRRGVAVVLASFEDPDTLMRLDIRSPRLEVIFRPWNDWELRTCLLGSPLEATGAA